MVTTQPRQWASVGKVAMEASFASPRLVLACTLYGQFGQLLHPWAVPGLRSECATRPPRSHQDMKLRRKSRRVKLEESNAIEGVRVELRHVEQGTQVHGCRIWRVNGRRENVFVKSAWCHKLLPSGINQSRSFSGFQSGGFAQVAIHGSC